MTKLLDITGKALSGEWGIDDDNGNGIPVLRTTNFTNEGIADLTNVVTRKINKNNIEYKYLRKGDIIIEKSGGSDKQPVGRVVYFDGPENIYLFNNFTGLLRIKNRKKWLPKYIFYSLYFNYRKGGTRRFENKTTGLHNLKIDDYVSKYDVKDISISLQTTMCNILDKIQEDINILQIQVSKYDELIKARFIEMFGDPIINSFRIETKPMTDVCEIIDGDRGKNYPTADEFFDEEYCLFLNAKNVTSTGFNFDTCMFVTKEKDEALRKGKLSRGDIVLTTRGTLGNLAFYTKAVPFEHVRINSGMVILRMKQDIVDEMYFIEQFKMQLADIREKIASGSAQPQLPISTMNKINILIPNIEKQRQFADFVRQIDKSKLAVQKSLEKTQQLFDSLMQEYFG